MINLRYHIVSITAVFLALGIGLAFGASFIDRATVDQLERNLQTIEDDNRHLESENADLSRRADVLAAADEGLRQTGASQLLAGQLQGVPVLVLAPAGIDDEVLRDTEAAISAAGADLAGTLTVTTRFALDDDDEVGDLRSILTLPNAVAPQLRTAVTRRFRTILAEAASPAPADPSATVVPTAAPPLVDQLLAGGFLEFDPVEEPLATFPIVPAHGLRLVVVSGHGADLADADFLDPLLTALLRLDPSQPDTLAPPIVAAEPTPPDDDPAYVPFVAALRDDDSRAARLSTVDHLDSFAGVTAVVLALAHAPAGQLGHYGSGDGAQVLLPPAVEAGG